MALMQSGPKPDSMDSGTVSVLPQRPHLPQWQTRTCGGSSRCAVNCRKSQLNAFALGASCEMRERRPWR